MGGWWVDRHGTGASKVVGGKTEKTLPFWVVGIGYGWFFPPASSSRNLRMETLSQKKDARAPSSPTPQPTHSLGSAATIWSSPPTSSPPRLALPPAATAPGPPSSAQ